MNDQQLAFMSTEALHEYGLRLESESNNVAAWQAMAGGPGGAPLIAELERELQGIMSEYRTLPAHYDHVDVLLSGLQGEERRVIAMLSKLRDAEKAKKMLDAERSDVVKQINLKEKAVFVTPSFVPRETVEEHKRSKKEGVQ